MLQPQERPDALTGPTERQREASILMSATTDFISELIRAANQIEQIRTSDRKQLLYRAVAFIRDGRGKVRIQPVRTTPDAMIDIMNIATSIERRSDGQVKAALLEAADMIRTLKIVLDAQDEHSRGH